MGVSSAPTVVIASGAPSEAANVAVFKAQLEKFNAHDLKAIATLRA